MKTKVFALFLLFSFNNALDVAAQKKAIKISGTVTDINNNPIKNAIIFIDSVRTDVKTKRNGFYKLKLVPEFKEIAVYVEPYGFLVKKYKGEKAINFVFRTKEDGASSEDVIFSLAYEKDNSEVRNSIKAGPVKNEDYRNIFDMLNRKFPFVLASAASIKIGKGVNTFNADPTPLILVDNIRSNISTLATLQPLDIKNIKVIRRGSEASQYGGLAAGNGVIVITLKTKD